MKRLIAGLGALTLTLLFAGGVSAQMGAHDFSGAGWSGGDLCTVCHTPHNAPGAAGAPLWDHAVSVADYSGTLYVGYRMDGAVGVPTGESLLCLSCHDGTVALDSYGGTTGTNFIATTAQIGTDLSDDHPVAVEYDYADTELRPTDYAPVWGGTLANVLGTGGPNGTVECASCHDVHDGNSAFFLRAPTANGVLCRSCHIK